MAIQIIDGFQVNLSVPVDSRIVASGSVARNAIPNKYHGLRVFDISDNIPYVWNGSAWVSENSTGISGSGNVFYFPRFSASNIITNSLLYQDGDILKTDDSGSGPDLIQLDTWYGSVTAQSFLGNGYQLTNLNGNNIDNGTITYNKIQNMSNGFLLVGGAGSNTQINPNQLVVGTSSVSNTSVVVSNSTNAINYLSFVASTSGNLPLRTVSNLQYNPGISQLTVGTISVVKINAPGGSLTNTTNSVINHMNLTATTTNSNRLEFNSIRNSAGNSWQSSGYRIQTRVDNEYMGYVQFGGFGNDTGLSFGTGYQGMTATGVFAAGNTYERMRIDISGRVFMNTPSAISTACILHLKSTSDLYDGLVHQSFNESHTIFEFKNNSGTQRGRIVGNGSSGVLYNTSSDKRLKKDIETMPSMYEKIKSLKPSRFKWKSDNKEEFGFIAQEVFNVFPNFRGELAYCDTNNPNFDIDNPVTNEGADHFYGLDYGRFTPYLTKALQETMEKLETLTNKIKNASSLEDLKNSL